MSQEIQSASQRVRVNCGATHEDTTTPERPLRDVHRSVERGITGAVYAAEGALGLLAQWLECDDTTLTPVRAREVPVEPLSGKASVGIEMLAEYVIQHLDEVESDPGAVQGDLARARRLAEGLLGTMLDIRAAGEVLRPDSGFVVAVGFDRLLTLLDECRAGLEQHGTPSGATVAGL